MQIEIRSDDSMVVQGYVNAVGRESNPIPSLRGRFVEQIVPKTFDKALRNTENVYLLFNHDKNKMLGSIKQGNLELRENSIGLYAKAIITDPEVIELGRNGKLRGWSFAFHSKKDRWEERADGVPKRYIEDLILNEVSILSKNPAYQGTLIETRDNGETLIETRLLEEDSEITDLSQVEKPPEDKEEHRNALDYSIYEQQISFLKMKGSKA